MTGFPGADAVPGSGPVHWTPAPKRNAQCSVERGGPAAMISRPVARVGKGQQPSKFCKNLK